MPSIKKFKWIAGTFIKTLFLSMQLDTNQMKIMGCEMIQIQFNVPDEWNEKKHTSPTVKERNKKCAKNKANFTKRY